MTTSFSLLALISGAVCLGGSVLTVLWHCVLTFRDSTGDETETDRLAHWSRITGLLFLVLAWMLAGGYAAARTVAHWIFWMGAACCAAFLVCLVLLGAAGRGRHDTRAGFRMNRWLPLYGLIMAVLGYLLGL